MYPPALCSGWLCDTHAVTRWSLGIGEIIDVTRDEVDGVEAAATGHRPSRPTTSSHWLALRLAKMIGLRLRSVSVDCLYSLSSASSVNCDIAIQWEWSNFDPSQNPNPLTDYDKTLHNRLRPRDEHVTQNLCQSTVRDRLGKYVKYKALSFFILNFFLGLTYWSNPCMEFHAQWFKTCVVT